MIIYVKNTKPYEYSILNGSGICLYSFRCEKEGYLNDIVRSWLSSFNEHIEVIYDYIGESND